MSHSDPLFLGLVYLAAMVLTVPIAKKLGLGAVLGYLIAGAVLGPSVFGVLGQSQEQILHFSEFGVIMMLFLIGLELKPSLLWKLKTPIFGLGGMQVGFTTCLLAFLGWMGHESWQVSLAGGMILSLSSTAIVLQTLQEKGALKTTGGETSFSVLLFQDIAVIPMLALFPLLATGEGRGGSGVPAPAAWNSAVQIFGAVLLVIICGRFLVRPLFRMIGASKLRELFTAMALLLVVGITLLMNTVGLSPALGAFLAGVVLAESEYRHQLEVDIEPFKGLLLGIFFISVGAGIHFSFIAERPLLVGGLVLLILGVKGLILFGVGKIGRLPKPDALLFAFSLAQGGEFAFVLLSFAKNEGVFGLTHFQALSAAVALSMFCAPVLIQSYFKWIQPRFSGCEEDRPADFIDENTNSVIIAGFGRFGQMTGRLLRGCGIRPTVLDFDAEQIDILRRYGLKAYYGDASQMDLLRSAGAAQAKLLILAIDDKEKTIEIIKSVKIEFPQLKILARAYDRIQAYELIQLGVQHPYIETAGSALALGIDALRMLGFSGRQAVKAAQTFNLHNDESIREFAKIYHLEDEKTMAAYAKNWLAALENILQKDILERDPHSHRAWEGPPRSEV